MDDLIARLESAESGSRELSDEVLLALGWELGGDDGFGGGHVWTWPAGFKPKMELHPRALRTRPHIPSPTESVDDALALVPEGWSGNVTFGLPDVLDAVELWNGRFAPRSCEIETKGHTPALALCIAILKAKEA